MRTLSATDELSDAIKSYKKAGRSIGLVPTMGALHEGHLSLIRKAKTDNDVVVVSIFINPLQFNNDEDLQQYPRVLEIDLNLLKREKVDMVFTPSERTLYPQKPSVSIDFGYLSEVLEGKYRKGHFKGVGIVVSKLLHLVQPNRAYFGMKDIQQFILIRKMCEELNFSSKIIGVETVREETGLALSSRNSRLSQEGKKSAAIIYQGLKMFEEGVLLGRSLEDIARQVLERLASEPGFDLEYLSAVSPDSLKPIDAYEKLDELVVCIAGYVDGIRLIDNLYLRLK